MPLAALIFSATMAEKYHNKNNQYCKLKNKLSANGCKKMGLKKTNQW
jgi:hypothetical protein